MRSSDGYLSEYVSEVVCELLMDSSMVTTMAKPWVWGNAWKPYRNIMLLIISSEAQQGAERAGGFLDAAELEAALKLAQTSATTDTDERALVALLEAVQRLDLKKE